MRNQTVTTRQELIDLHNRIWDIVVWSNAPTFVAVEGSLISYCDRFICSNPSSYVHWTTLLSFGRAVLEQDVHRLGMAVYQAMREDHEHYARWKSTFDDDELWRGLLWLHSEYRIRKADPGCVVFQWDA
jgi:hypothetical protein